MTDSNQQPVEETQLATVPPHALMGTLPDYMQGTTDLGMDNLEGYYSPPRLSIIQGMTPEPAKNLGPEGTIYTRPSLQVAWSPAFPAAGKPTADPPMVVVPVFMYAEFICWNPREVQGLSPIRERTFDRNSDLAKRCQAKKQDDRRFICPEAPAIPGKEPIYCKYQEHINFIVTLIDHPDLWGIEAAMSFYSTGLTEGRAWCSTIKMKAPVPMFGQIYGLQGNKVKTNAKGVWKGFDIQPLIDPTTGKVSLVSPEWFPHCQERYNKLLLDYQQGLLVMEYDKEDDIDDTSTGVDQAAVNAAKAKY